MLSEPNARILQHILSQGNVVFTHELPEGFTAVRLEGLVDLGFLHPIVHPICGLIGYQLLPAGEDALAEKKRVEQEMLQDVADQKADEKRRSSERAQDKRRDFVYFILGLLFGWLLGLVSPSDVMNAIRSLRAIISSLFH